MTARFTKVYHAALKQLKPLLTLVEQVREARAVYECYSPAIDRPDEMEYNDSLRETLEELRDQLELGE